jgi:hypothetical protein
LATIERCPNDDKEFWCKWRFAPWLAVCGPIKFQSDVWIVHMDDARPLNEKNRRTPFPTRPWWLGAALLGAIGLGTGCGGTDLKLGQVSGRVTLDGKPVPNAFITFDPQFEGRPSLAKSDMQGRYELRFNSTKWGALIGEHHVRVSTEDLTPDDKAIPELIPKAYRGTDGFLPVTVKSGKNSIDLELKGGPIK